MKRVTLVRFAYTPFGVFGRMSVEDDFRCYTVEREWQDNATRVSCIPEGVYPLILDRYHKGNYDAYEVMGVPARDRILIHKGNTEDDLEGCIAPGKDLGWINQKWAVVQSVVAFQQFMEVMAREPGSLTITRWAA